MRKIITILTIIMILFSIFAVLTVSNAADEETEEFTWTDFSNAKYEIKRTANVDAYIEITGVTPNEGSTYKGLITADSNKPEINSDYSATDEDALYIEYAEDTKTFQTENITKYIELNQELYISIIEKNSNATSRKVVTYGNKLTRYSEPKYNDAFFTTFMSKDKDQLVTNFTHDESNNRKIQIKVGKITDTTILQKLKNGDSSGFSDLLSFAKSNSSIYNQTLDADKNSNRLEYITGELSNNTNSVINLQGLENKNYYYLYIKTDDENGKYISNEAVTLTQANVYSSGWGMYFYGSNDFKWADFSTIDPDPNTGKKDPAEDPTIAPTILPKTGINVIIIAGVLGIGMLAVVTKKRYNNYKDI